MARGKVVSVENSAIGAAIGEDVLLAGSRSFLTAGDRVEMREAGTVVLLARNVDGPVTTTLDTRGALLAGLTAGIALGLVLFVGSLLAKRE
jgi:hypothetical protein